MTFDIFIVLVSISVFIQGIGIIAIFCMLNGLEEHILSAINGPDSDKEKELTNELKQSADALQSGIDSNKPK